MIRVATADRETLSAVPLAAIAPRGGWGRPPRRRLPAALSALAVALGILVPAIAPGPAVAGQLDPSAFPSQGTLTLSSGTYTITTNGAAVLMNSSGTVLATGTTFSQGGSFDPTISVLDFNSISIGTGVTINVTGSDPLALLSRGMVTISGTINADGQNGENASAGGLGGAGGPGAARVATATGHKAPRESGRAAGPGESVDWAITTRSAPAAASGATAPLLPATPRLGPLTATCSRRSRRAAAAAARVPTSSRAAPAGPAAAVRSKSQPWDR